MLVNIRVTFTNPLITGNTDEVRVQSEEPNLKKPAFERAFCFLASGNHSKKKKPPCFRREA